MTARILVAAPIILGLACGPAGSDPKLAERQKALEEGQAAIKKDLEEIKDLLKARSPRPPREATEVMLSVDGEPFKGATDARVTIVEFSDYQCPFCARHATQTFPKIDEAYLKSGKVKYVFRDLPLEQIHPQAVKAAEAALCAGESGKYWEMHDRLFANQKALAPVNLVGYAKAIGIDPKKFQSCLDGGRYAAEIRKDLADAQKAGARGSPTFFVGLSAPGGTEFKAVQVLRGAQPFERFKEAIDKLLASAESPTAGRTAPPR